MGNDLQPTDQEPQRVAIGTGDNFVVQLENLFHDFINDIDRMRIEKLETKNLS